MNNNPNGHIGEAELARLLEESRRRPESAVHASDVHPHLAACPDCRKQFEELASLDDQLGRRLQGDRHSAAESAPHDGDCPDPAVWREIAGGLTPATQTLTHIEHASRCDSCGPLLRDAVAELNDLNRDVTAAERHQIAALPSASVEWQQRLAQRIAGTQDSSLDPQPTLWWRSWLAAPRLTMAITATTALLLAAVIGVGSWVVLQRNQPARADHLLARAYTEQRTLELRIAGADYAPLRVSRGPEASFTSRSEALLKAEDLIAGQLASHPSDPAWLQAQAQADLLEGKYDAAVEALRRALELQPQSPEFLIDLATAYFQRAQQEDRKDDCGAAYEFLSQALRLRPDDPVALFNRAIVAEQQFLYHQALDDWEHYLRVDPTSQWREEARSRANAVREKLKQHDSGATLLLSPAQLANAAGASLGTEVDSRIEDYLQEAVSSWLPQAFPEAKAHAEADPSARRALFFLAELTSRQHADLWLTDLLGGSSAPNFSQAVAGLAAAVKANDTGEYDRSGEQAILAARLFQSSGNTAGVLRAEFEQVFSAQVLRQSENCRRQAIAATTESEKHPYWWLQVQLGLERSVCSGLMGDMGADQKAALRALERAEQAGYRALSLRALEFVAQDRSETGDRSSAWRLAQTGLARYWSGQSPAMRGRNLYGVAADMAESAGWPNLQLALWGEGLALIDLKEDLLLQAGVHGETARAAMAAGQPQLAEQHYAEAARLYGMIRQTDVVRAFRLHSQIWAAQAELHLGHFDDALKRLTDIQDEVRRLSETYLVQTFYSTLGELQLRRHREVEAEEALRPALALAEKNLASLRSEEERTRWSKDAAPVYLSLAEAELAQGRVNESLQIFEWYLGAGQRAGIDSRRTSRRNLPDPSELSSRLSLLSRETVLAYGLLPDGLAIWTYDDRGVSAQWIPKEKDELEELAGRFYDLTSDPKSDSRAVRRDAHILYGLLIAPIEPRFDPGRTIVIETDGWLSRLPFEALLDASGHYLLERAPIVHSIGMYSDELLRPGGSISADSPALVIGSTAASQADGQFPLPDAIAEARTVANGFQHARLLEGDHATLSMVQDGLRSAAVFHFAGHSLSTSERTGLMLEGRDPHTGRPRLLDADSLRNSKSPNLQLAVLSACSTGKASPADSSGYNTIAETLLRAGVPHVVASRWAVDSVQTRGFVEDFYRNLLSGTSFSASTRLTARKMLANPQTAHPYYWSAFAAYGRP